MQSTEMEKTAWLCIRCQVNSTEGAQAGGFWGVDGTGTILGTQP